MPNDHPASEAVENVTRKSQKKLLHAHILTGLRNLAKGRARFGPIDPVGFELETLLSYMSLATVKTIEDLFEVWRKDRPEYTCFSNDGILVEDLWKKATPKIAFLLKESNDHFFNIRGRGWGPEGNSPRFWRNLSMWTYIATECLNGRECTLPKTIEEKEKLLEPVAYINIKKKAECKPKSSDEDIHSYIDRDWGFLNRQIEIIAPDILFCCGSFKYLRRKIQLEHISERIHYFQHLLVVDFYHPSYPYRSNESNFRLLHEMFSSIPEKHRQRSPANQQLSTTTVERKPSGA